MELLLPILLILVGLGLIIAEVYLVPGFNVIGIVGFLMILFALGYGFTEHGITGGVVLLAGTVVVGGATFYMLWTSGAWDRFVLATSLRRDDLAEQREAEDRSRYLGKVGRAVTPLRPTGVVEIDGDRLEVVTEGEFIAAGSAVKIVAMDRRRYFVRLADAITAPSSAT
ncbi:MAG TPA: NfeD family protein [Rhodothermales bacterium]